MPVMFAHFLCDLLSFHERKSPVKYEKNVDFFSDCALYIYIYIYIYEMVSCVCLDS